MKILSISQLKEADQITLKKQGITSLELMERAATLAFNEIHASLSGFDAPIKIFCGVGNNGGDGLVIARLLIEKGYHVKTFVVNHSDKRSEGFLHNYDRIKEVNNDWPVLLTPKSDLPEISENDLVIDAIFGIGLNRQMPVWVAKLVQKINDSKAVVLSIDMPSGLFAEKAPAKKEVVMKARVTLTFQSPKLVFFLPQTAKFVGNFIVIDIGLDREYLQKTKTQTQLMGKQEVLPFYRSREKFSHKGTYGHSLIVGGSYGKIGSVVLASSAAFRAGAGKVTAWVPKCGNVILQMRLPEAMVITSDENDFLTKKELPFEPTVICFGVGAGKHPKTVLALEHILNEAKAPMVIDADGINILSENTDLLKKLPENSILTPHPKELERLIGTWKDDFEKLKKAKEFVKKHHIILVIKGAFTLVIEENNLFINTTGNPGMATAGSGDVLAGVITGLLSQGYDPVIAAIFGVYLHGRAGDSAAGRLGVESMMAGDISKNIGKAFLDLFSKPKPPAPVQQQPKN